MCTPRFDLFWPQLLLLLLLLFIPPSWNFNFKRRVAWFFNVCSHFNMNRLKDPHPVYSDKLVMCTAYVISIAPSFLNTNFFHISS